MYRNHAEKANKENMEGYYKLLSYTDKAKKKVKCEICDVEVPYVKRNVIQHMKGRNHADNARDIEKMKEYSKLLSFTDETNKAICKICDVEVPYVRLNIIQHMEGRNHADNARDIEKMKQYSKLLSFTDETNKAICKICDVEVPYVRLNIIQHMKGRNHADNARDIEKMKQYSKLLSFTDETNKAICKICDVEVPYVRLNIIQHMEGRNHEAVENELMEYHFLTEESSGYDCECCEIHTTDYFEHINSRTHTLTFLKNVEIDKDEMRNYVYEDDVNDSDARFHRELYRNLLKYNNIIELSDTRFYCGICQTKMGRFNEIDHVLGERHGRNINHRN